MYRSDCKRKIDIKDVSTFSSIINIFSYRDCKTLDTLSIRVYRRYAFIAFCNRLPTLKLHYRSWIRYLDSYEPVATTRLTMNFQHGSMHARMHACA